MEINLKEDRKSITEYLLQKINNYNSNGPELGNKDDLILNITLGYEVNQSCWIALIFDSRPNASSDGERTMKYENNSLEMPHWYEQIERSFETNSPTSVILPNNEKITISDDQEDQQLEIIIGEMLRDILIELKDNNKFLNLPIHDNCTIGVEDLYGDYGRPEYEKRYSEGLVKIKK